MPDDVRLLDTGFTVHRLMLRLVSGKQAVEVRSPSLNKYSFPSQLTVPDVTSHLLWAYLIFSYQVSRKHVSCLIENHKHHST